jgi:hypothetical protein
VTSCDRSEPAAINNAGVIAGTIRLAGSPSAAAVPVLWRPGDAVTRQRLRRDGSTGPAQRPLPGEPSA